MSSNTEWQPVTDALRAEIEALRARLSALETAQPSVSDSTVLPRSEGDYLEYFNDHIQAQLKRDREALNGQFAFAVMSSVAQSGRDGNIGTSFGLTTFDQVADLPTDEQLAQRREHALLYLNPVVLPVLRTFYELRFAGKPMRATAAELAARVGTSAEEVTEALRPLVELKKIERGLHADNTPFYQWGGDKAVAVALLFHD